MEDSRYKLYIQKSNVEFVKVLKVAMVGLIISGLVMSSILLTSTTVLQASSKGLKLYLTVDTNLRSQDIGIETYQHGDNIYGHNGFMSTGSNEYTLNYPSGRVDTGQFEICINTNDGRFCGNGYNSEESRPESVFINAQEGTNFGSVPQQQDDSQSQSQASNQEQETSQSQSQTQGDTIIYNCPANARCVIEN